MLYAQTYSWSLIIYQKLVQSVLVYWVYFICHLANVAVLPAEQYRLMGCLFCFNLVTDQIVLPGNTLCVDAGPIAKVDDFRFLGGWLKSSDDDFRHGVPQAWQACNSMWRVWKCPTLSRDCKRTLFQATVGTVLLYNAEMWTTTRALERRIEFDGIYTRLLRKALDVSWQQHMTNEELYGKISSAMHQLREQRLTFAGHCYQCEDQPVKHLVLWEGRAGRMLRGQANRSLLPVWGSASKTSSLVGG